jgi:hypothetical protein
MDDRTFDALTRRASLLSLSVAVLAAFSTPPASARRKKNDSNKNAKQRCRTQIGQCTAVIAQQCLGTPEECLKALECCDFAGQCDFTGFINCLLLVDE